MQTIDKKEVEKAILVNKIVEDDEKAHWDGIDNVLPAEGDTTAKKQEEI